MNHFSVDSSVIYSPVVGYGLACAFSCFRRQFKSRLMDMGVECSFSYAAGCGFACAISYFRSSMYFGNSRFAEHG